MKTEKTELKLRKLIIGTWNVSPISDNMLRGLPATAQQQVIDAIASQALRCDILFVQESVQQSVSQDTYLLRYAKTNHQRQCAFSAATSNDPSAEIYVVLFDPKIVTLHEHRLMQFQEYDASGKSTMDYYIDEAFSDHCPVAELSTSQNIKSTARNTTFKFKKVKEKRIMLLWQTCCFANIGSLSFQY